MGMTQGSRPGIFTARAAPIQVNYLGYPGTIGADCIDYMIADGVTVPATHRAYYQEKIVALPGSFMPQDPTRAISDRAFTRTELGLPETGFVFCCFNASYKFNPQVIACWMTILKNSSGSVLWLAESNPKAVARLQERGICSRCRCLASDLRRQNGEPRGASGSLSRGGFVSRHVALQRPRHCKRCTVGGCSGAHACWRDFPGQVGASLVNAAGLDELIKTTDAAYIASAIELAADPDKLAAVKRKLSLNRASGQLFDMPSYVKHIEAAYRRMYDKHLAGAQPEHIQID